MARPGRPTLEQSEDLTTRIVAAAIRMFLEKGYAGATIDQLASTLGIAKRSFYSRFSSKADLFRAAADSYAAAGFDGLPAVEIDDRPVADQLLDVCIDLLRYFLHPDVIAMERTFLAEAVRFPEMMPVLEDVRFRAIGRLHPVLRLIGADPDRDLADDARVVWDLTVGPRMRGAALGLWPCAVTEETMSITRERIALFLAARRELPSTAPSTETPRVTG